MRRPDLLRNNKKREREEIKLITIYNPYSPNPNKILHEYKGLMLMTRKEAITPEDIQVIHSGSSYLGDILIKGEPQQTIQMTGCQPCGKQCKTCEHITSTNEIFPINVYEIRENFNCQSNNVVYVLTCTISNINYVGETENAVNTRSRSHESNEKHQRQSSITPLQRKQ